MIIKLGDVLHFRNLSEKQFMELSDTKYFQLRKRYQDPASVRLEELIRWSKVLGVKFNELVVDDGKDEVILHKPIFVPKPRVPKARYKTKKIVNSTKIKVVTMYFQGIPPWEIVKELGVTRAMVNFYLNETDGYEPRREYRVKREVKASKVIEALASILNISLDDAKVAHECGINPQKAKMLSRLNKLDIAIGEHKPKTLDELSKIVGEKPNCIAGFLSRFCPEMLRAISRRPTSSQILDRKAKIRELRLKDPNISITRIAKILGMKTPTLYVWLANNSL